MWQPLNYIRYIRDLRKQSKAEKSHDKKRPPETRDSYESGEMQYFFKEEEELYEWKRLIQTRYLRNRADRLLVQMPSVDDPKMYDRVEWDKDSSEPRYLTDEGMRVARAAIREELKHRREAVGYWFGIVIGIIGALTGLVSAFKG